MHNLYLSLGAVQLLKWLKNVLEGGGQDFLTHKIICRKINTGRNPL